MTISQEILPSGITLVTLANDHGLKVTLSSLGAGIISLFCPDRYGKEADVVLGYADASDYLNDDPCMGKTPGRYAGRIARGRFNLEGKLFRLPINNGPNHLHGGPDGFQNKRWNVEILPAGVRFSLVSSAYEMGYPGELAATVDYTIEEEFNTLYISYRATTTHPTVVNLTNHTYWNLRGHDAGHALQQTLQLKCRTYLPVDENLIPLPGKPLPVAGTPLDFTEAKPLAQAVHADFPAIKAAKGLDTTFPQFKWKAGKLVQDVAVLHDPVSGRVMSMATDQPAVQVYTGNFLAGCPAAKGGKHYADYDGVALEAQGFPDAPNRPRDFPRQSLMPGQTYLRRINFTFTTSEQ